MDVAITIFRIGVGVGAVLVGVGIILIAVSLRPLARDTRALANDARRLARLAERELSGLIEAAQQQTDDGGPRPDDAELRLAQAARLPPVQSRDAREGERIA